jgi:hypothetical protein
MPQNLRYAFALAAVVTVLGIEAHSQTEAPTYSLPNPYR